MKKLLLTCALVAAVTAAFAQGTVQFSNGTLSKMSLVSPGVSTVVIPTTASFSFGLFYGVNQSTSLSLLTSQFGINSTSSAGIIVNPLDRKSAMNTIPLGTETSGGETDIWVQMKGWDASFGTDWLKASEQGTYFGASAIRNIGGLGPSTGPGVAIWQSATGTSLLTMPAFGLTLVPEPTTLALAGMGVASLLIFRRRK
jgi:hypothetical protein